MSSADSEKLDIIARGIVDLRENMDKRFDAVEKRLDQHDQLFVKFIDRFDSVDDQLKDLNRQVSSLVTVQASTDRELIDHDNRLTALEHK